MLHQSLDGAFYFLASLTIRLGRCGHILPESKIRCSQSSKNVYQWLKLSLAKSWNAFELTTEESLSLKNSSDFADSVTSDVNTWHLIVSRMTSWKFLDVRHTPSYRKTIAENLNRGLGNAFSLIMDQTTRSGTNFGTPSTEISSKFGRSVQWVGYA